MCIVSINLPRITATMFYGASSLHQLRLVCFILFSVVSRCKVPLNWTTLFYPEKPSIYFREWCEAVKSIRHSCSITSMEYTKQSATALHRCKWQPNDTGKAKWMSSFATRCTPSITLKTSKTMLITCHLFGSYPWIMTFPFLFPDLLIHISPPDALSMTHL